MDSLMAQSDLAGASLEWLSVPPLSQRVGVFWVVVGVVEHHQCQSSVEPGQSVPNLLDPEKKYQHSHVTIHAMYPSDMASGY